MSIAILIDATSKNTFINLIKNKEVIIDHKHYVNNNDLSHKLATYIDDIIKTNNFTNKDITDFYLVYGPGKFSAMRICATVAKTWKVINGTNLFILDRLNFYATPNCLCIIESDGNKSFASKFIDSKIQSTPELIENILISKYIEENIGFEIINESANQENLISKLDSFEQVDENFELKYLRSAC
ncbi:MAG: hypothetical protein ACRC42_04060 [Mycoplasma sp.]